MKQPYRWTALLAVLISMSFLTGCELSNDSDDDDDKDASSDRAKIVGTWKVITQWRWSKMTFKADGTRSVVDRVTGEKFTRGSWSLEDGKLVVVSDITEEWDYVVTKSSLTVTLPSGNVIQMVRVKTAGEPDPKTDESSGYSGSSSGYYCEFVDVGSLPPAVGDPIDSSTNTVSP